MAAPPYNPTPFDLWKNTIDAAKTDPAWAGYDAAIKETVDTYNTHLASAKNFRKLNWKLIKAMVWTESGGPTNPAWKSRPIQIGNAGDPGLAALLSGTEGGELILPPPLAKALTANTAAAQPLANIQAGVGYLLMRAAKYGFANVEDPDDPVHDYVVKSGDSFSRIAGQNGSTTQELQALNPGIQVIHPGQHISIKKAQIVKQIIDFLVLDTATVAKLYNNHDLRYADKLDYCLSIIH